MTPDSTAHDAQTPEPYNGPEFGCACGQTVSARSKFPEGHSEDGPCQKRYVAGFLIDRSRREVALVRKMKPAWQAGRWNGIGGKIEPGESPIEAMVREFREEAGVQIDAWEPFTVLGAEHFEVHFFRAFAERDMRDVVSTQEEEPIEVVSLDAITVDNAIPNLTWLIPMALSMDYENTSRFAVTEQYDAA